MLSNRALILLTRKLTGEANDSELSEYNHLLQEDPEFEQVAIQLGEYWDVRQDSDEEFLEATYLLHLERVKQAGLHISHPENLLEEAIIEPAQPRRKRKRFIQWVVPAVLILAAFTWFLNMSKADDAQLPKISSGNSQISTRNGSRSKIELPDGSSVWLNAGSKIEYDKAFDSETREVYLTGEAYFDVVRNPERPFIVNTRSAKVKVLGTAFNVRCYPDDNKIETSLIHGSVEVTLNKNPEQKWVLKPNQKLVLLNDYVAPQMRERVADHKKTMQPEIAVQRLTYLPGETTAVETAWTYNILSFEDESFIEVSKKMARWYDVEFVFKNKELEELMLHGSFTTETIREAMDALQYSFKFRYDIKDKIVTIY